MTTNNPHITIPFPQTPSQELEGLCLEFSVEARAMDASIGAYETELSALNKKYLPRLKKQVGIVAGLEAALYTLVENAPELFAKPKPRTQTFHGVKVGFTVSKGKVTFDDSERVVRLLKKVFKKDARYLDYLHVKEEPDKDAIREILPEYQSQIACRIEGAGDQVFVERVDGDIAKLMTRLTTKLVEAMTGKE